MYSAADHVIIIAEIAFYEKHFIIMYQNTACAIPEPVVTLFKSAVVFHLFLPHICRLCLLMSYVTEP